MTNLQKILFPYETRLLAKASDLAINEVSKYRWGRRVPGRPPGTNLIKLANGVATIRGAKKSEVLAELSDAIVADYVKAYGAADNWPTPAKKNLVVPCLLAALNRRKKG